MLRTLTPVYAATSSGVAAAFPCTLINLQGYFNGASDAWLQIHDVAAVPANGAVPLKSFQLLAKMAYSWKFDPNVLVLKTGLYVCVSTTDATKTLSADTADFLIDIGEYEEQMQPDVSTAGDLVTNVPYQLIWARTGSPTNRLKKVIATNNEAFVAYLLMFGLLDSDLISTNTKAIASFKFTAGQTRTLYFGNKNGFIPRQVTARVANALTTDYGCTFAWSTDPLTYVDSAGTYGTIKGFYRAI